MASISRCSLRIGTAFLGLLTYPSLAAAQAAPDMQEFLQSAKIPLPPGSFASWPAESRDPAIRGLRARCTFVTGMAFAGGYPGPKAALGPEVVAIISACVAKGMPDDWPGVAAERQQSASSYETARRLDPKAPDPELIAGAIAGLPANPH